MCKPRGLGTCLCANRGDWAPVCVQTAGTGHLSVCKLRRLGTCLCANRGDWAPAFLQLDTNRGDWRPAFLQLDTNRGDWAPAFLQLDTNRGDWGPAFLQLDTNRGDWRPAFLQLDANRGAVLPTGPPWEESFTRLASCFPFLLTLLRELNHPSGESLSMQIRLDTRWELKHPRGKCLLRLFGLSLTPAESTSLWLTHF